MKLSVILPCFNGAKTITNQLEALTKQQWSGSWEVVVSNNGSTDESMTIVERYRDRLPGLRVVNAYTPPGPRLGVVHSYNVGIKAAAGDACVFCEADDEVAPGWLAAMGEALSKYDFVAGSLEYRKLNEAWLIKDDQEMRQEKGLLTYEYYPHLPYASGCNLGFKRSTYETAGELDESISCAWDVEYCCRVQLAGIKLHFVPDAVTHCRLRHTLGGMYRQGRNWGKDYILLRNKYESLSKSITLKQLAGVGLHLSKVFLRISDKADFAGWFWELGWKVGQVQGCVEYLH